MAKELNLIAEFASIIRDQFEDIGINCKLRDTIANMVADMKVPDIEFSYKD